MEFQWSDIVRCDETQSLCKDIPFRKHRYSDKEDIGATRAQRDWAKLVGPIGIYRGGLGPEYSFISVTVPECLPERIEILSYANEYAFLYDDVMENLDKEQAAGDGQELLDVFGQEVLKSPASVNVSGAKRIQSQILAEMITIDPARAVTSMKAWATFVQQASDNRRAEPFNTLEEYLPFRLVDAGQMIWFGMVTFGMALTIPEREMDLCRNLTQPIYAAMGLANDLFSWDKERDAAEQKGVSHVLNAIWVLMKEYSITEVEAERMCRVKIEDYVGEYERIFEATRNDCNISVDLRKYIEALRYSHSGNLVWSLYCPRYHPSKSFNQTQLSLLNGDHLRLDYSTLKSPMVQIKTVEIPTLED